MNRPIRQRASAQC